MRYRNVLKKMKKSCMKIISGGILSRNIIQCCHSTDTDIHFLWGGFYGICDVE